MDDLENIRLREIKSDIERQIQYVIIYMWNLKRKQRNEYNKTETDSLM